MHVRCKVWPLAHLVTACEQARIGNLERSPGALDALRPLEQRDKRTGWIPLLRSLARALRVKDIEHSPERLASEVAAVVHGLHCQGP